jgi:hypothetical protein
MSKSIPADPLQPREVPSTRAGWWLQSRLIMGLTAVVLTTVPSASGQAADEPTGPTTPHAEAARLFQEGNVLYRQGNYDGAIAKFRAANTLAPDPLTIFAIAQAQRLGGDCHALESYAAFVAATPNTGLTAVAQTHMADLARRCPPARAAAQPTSVPKQVASPFVETSRSAGDHAEGAPVHKRWWLWTVAGALVAGSAAASFALWARPGETPTAVTHLGTMPVNLK